MKGYGKIGKPTHQIEIRCSCRRKNCVKSQGLRSEFLKFLQDKVNAATERIYREANNFYFESK